MKKYNIALVPKHVDDFLNHAATLSALIKPEEYLIGNYSIPHVTLCHFVPEDEALENIWSQVKCLENPYLRLGFNKQRSKEYLDNPKWKGVFWVSLIPDHLDKLKNLHLAVARIIKNPTNMAFDQYDPHMTLFNSRDKESCDEINDSSQVDPPLKDDFVIVLGRSDDSGQLIEILQQYKQ